MIKKFLIATTVGATLIVPAVGMAGYMDKWDAGDEVSRVADGRYNIDPVVLCRNTGPKTFTCSVSDFKDTCSYSGRAEVKKVSSYRYRVTYLKVRRSCF